MMPDNGSAAGRGAVPEAVPAAPGPEQREGPVSSGNSTGSMHQQQQPRQAGGRLLAQQLQRPGLQAAAAAAADGPSGAVPAALGRGFGSFFVPDEAAAEGAPAAPPPPPAAPGTSQGAGQVLPGRGRDSPGSQPAPRREVTSLVCEMVDAVVQQSQRVSSPSVGTDAAAAAAAGQPQGAAVAGGTGCSGSPATPAADSCSPMLSSNHGQQQPPRQQVHTQVLSPAALQGSSSSLAEAATGFNGGQQPAAAAEDDSMLDLEDLMAPEKPAAAGGAGSSRPGQGAASSGATWAQPHTMLHCHPTGWAGEGASGRQQLGGGRPPITTGFACSPTPVAPRGAVSSCSPYLYSSTLPPQHPQLPQQQQRQQQGAWSDPGGSIMPWRVRGSSSGGEQLGGGSDLPQLPSDPAISGVEEEDEMLLAVLPQLTADMERTVGGYSAAASGDATFPPTHHTPRSYGSNALSPRHAASLMPAVPSAAGMGHSVPLGGSAGMMQQPGRCVVTGHQHQGHRQHAAAHQHQWQQQQQRYDPPHAAYAHQHMGPGWGPGFGSMLPAGYGHQGHSPEAVSSVLAPPGWPNGSSSNAAAAAGMAPEAWRQAPQDTAAYRAYGGHSSSSVQETQAYSGYTHTPPRNITSLKVTYAGVPVLPGQQLRAPAPMADAAAAMQPLQPIKRPRGRPRKPVVPGTPGAAAAAAAAVPEAAIAALLQQQQARRQQQLQQQQQQQMTMAAAALPPLPQHGHYHHQQQMLTMFPPGASLAAPADGSADRKRNSSFVTLEQAPSLKLQRSNSAGGAFDAAAAASAGAYGGQ